MKCASSESEKLCHPKGFARKVPLYSWIALLVFTFHYRDSSAQQPATPHPDRSEPMRITSGSAQGSLKDNGVTTLSGGVRIVQGSLSCQADRVLVTIRDSAPIDVTMFGEPASLNQTTVRGERMSASAAKIFYAMESDVIQLFGAAEVRHPNGLMRGEYIEYNMSTGSLNAGAEGGRVNTIIIPRTSRR